MNQLVVGALVGISALFLSRRLEQRRALQRMARSRVGQCERCGASMDPEERFVVEGVLCCGACAARTRRHSTAAHWGFVFIGVAGSLFGALGVWASWRRGEHPSIWEALGLVLMFPALSAGCLFAARRLGHSANRWRLRDEAEHARALERLASANWPDPPGPRA